MSSYTKVLFLEMDAGDKFLIRQWAADGTMPTWRRLLERGLVADTFSLDGFFVGATWPSLYTGVNPARHGFHSLMQLKPDTYEFQWNPPGESVKHTPFWLTLSQAGKRVAVLDVPLSWLCEDINGVQTVEWGAHDQIYGFRAHPKELEQDIRQRFGVHPLKGVCNSYGRTPADFVELRNNLIDGIRKKREITKYILRQGRWDFFCQVFTESHCIGHQCWHLHDVEHPAHDSIVRAITGDPVREVYREIDLAIGSILDEVESETLIVLLAGHRMGHKFGAQFLLPKILAQMGVAVAAEPPERPPVRRLLNHALTSGWGQTPRIVKRPLRPLSARVSKWANEDTPIAPHLTALDPALSKCFVLDNGFPVSGLRVNLQGREPNGLVSPGTEFDVFCHDLAKDLLQLVNAHSGRRMVKSVKRTDQLYEGPYLQYLPDLLVEWSDRDVLGSASCGNPAQSELTVRSEKLGQVSGTNTYPRTGDHRPEGMLVAIGPKVSGGNLGRTISLMDVAPTLAAALGVVLPDVDGTAVSEMV